MTKKNTQDVTIFGRFENKCMFYFAFENESYGLAFADDKNAYSVGDTVTISYNGTFGTGDFAFKVEK